MRPVISFIIFTISVVLCYNSEVKSQGIPLIDQSVQDTITTEDSSAEDSFEVYQEYVEEPEQEYHLFQGDWRGIYILHLILPPIIFTLIFILLYRRRVGSWVHRKKKPSRLRNLYTLVTVLQTVVIYGFIFGHDTKTIHIKFICIVFIKYY